MSEEISNKSEEQKTAPEAETSNTSNNSQAEKGANKTSSLGAALSEAERIIAAAEDRAEALIEQARLDAKEVREQAYIEGLAKGREDVADAAISLIEDNSKIEEELSTKAVKLALSISSTIISQQVKIEPSIVTKIAEKAIEASVIGESATIVVNPADSKTLKDASEDLEKLVGGAKFTIETSKLITPGGCLIKTDYGEVDAKIETLVAQIAQRLGVS